MAILDSVVTNEGCLTDALDGTHETTATGRCEDARRTSEDTHASITPAHGRRGDRPDRRRRHRATRDRPGGRQLQPLRARQDLHRRQLPDLDHQGRPNCAAAGVVDAGWTAVSTAGDVNSIILENSARSGSFYVFGDDPLGKWTWRPEGAFDAADNQIFQYTPVTDVRLASYSRITPTRTGTKVNLKTLANRWWGNGDKFIGYASARGQIQYRTPGTTTWHSLKDVYSSSTGTYSYTYNTTLTRDYRVVIYDAPTNTIWGSTSPAVRK